MTTSNLLNDKPAIEAHLHEIARALSGPDAGGKKPTLRERIIVKSVVFLVDLLSKRFTRFHDSLLARVTAIEQRPHQPFFWEWKRGDSFTVGAFATHRGCLWQCQRPTDAEPGGSADWKLIVGTVEAR